METFPKIAKSYGPGRHEGQTNIEAKVAELSLDGEQTGDMDTTGHYALVRFDDEERAELAAIRDEDGELYFPNGSPYAAIVATNSQGFVHVTYSVEGSANAWKKICDEVNAQEFEYDADCPACLRDHDHDKREHQAALARSRA